MDDKKETLIPLEQDVPLPTLRKRGWDLLVHVAHDGDSVLLKNKQERNSLLTAARRAKVKVTTQKQKDGTIRVWFMKGSKA